MVVLLLDTTPISTTTLGSNTMSHHYDHEQQPQDHHDQYNIFSKKMELLGSSADSFLLQFPQDQLLDPSTPSNNGGGVSTGGGHTNNNMNIPTTVKKLNHNATERDRRKKINDLYSSLCSLLPSSDQMKKSSIPTTVSRVVKYIPELQKQVEKLMQKKENLTSKQVLKNDIGHQAKQRKGDAKIDKSLANVSTSMIGEREIVVQMTTMKVDKSSHVLLSEILSNLQEDGFHVINASSFETFGDQRVFYNIHLQVEGEERMDETLLSEKLQSYFG